MNARAWELLAVPLRAARRAGLVWGLSLAALIVRRRRSTQRPRTSQSRATSSPACRRPAYQRTGRPRPDNHVAFVRVRHPHIGPTAMAVRQIVAGPHPGRLPRLAAHRLRHTLASDLLRAGTPLAQVAGISMSWTPSSSTQ